MSTSSVLFDAPGPKARRRNRIAGVLSVLVGILLVVIVARRFGDYGQFDGAKWEPFVGGELWEFYLLPGLVGTLKAAGISIVCASVFGIVFALARMSSIAPLRWVAGVIVEFFRAIPVLLMMIFSYGMYVQFEVLPPEQAPLLGVVTALTLYNGSVMCEVVRAGVDQLPAGQREAGWSIGLSRQQTLRTILLPQAITAMLPSLVSQLVVILKDTALGYNITHEELLRAANDAAPSYSNLIPLIAVVAVIYILLNYAVTKLAEWLENRLKRRGHTSGTPDADVMAGTTAGPDMRFNQHTG